MDYPEQVPRWRRYLRLVRPSVQGDVDDELRFHFESRVDELIAQGTTPDAARRQAGVEFGDVDEIRRGLVSIDERVASRRGRGQALRDIGGDVAYAVRSLRRTPGVALAILATLALGVGANAAMFTLLRTIFLRPPAGVAHADGVRRLWAEYNYRDGVHYSTVVSYPQFVATTAAAADQADVAISRLPQPARVLGADGESEIQLSYVGARYFSLLGVRPGVGRLFSPDEMLVGVPVPVVVMSDAYWRGALHADPSALGRTLVVNGKPFTIIGVAGRDFTGVDLDAAQAWLPLAFYGANWDASMPWWRNTRVNGLSMLLRPRPGSNERLLEQRLTVALRRADVRAIRDDSSTVVRLGGIVEANGPGEQSPEQRIAIRLAGVAVIVLLIACANVANLLLARAVRRRREIAVRLALGISRARLIRLLLVESGVLALMAAAVAITIAYAGGSLLRTLLLPDVHWGTAPIDWSVVLFTAGIAIMTGLVAGLVPAIHAAQPELSDALKAGPGAGGFHRSRLRSSLVVAQAALSVVLLVGAVLFVRSLLNIHDVDIGFDRRRLLTASVSFDDRARWKDPAMPARIAELASAIARLPGVERVALASIEPMAGFSTMSYFTETDSLGSRAGWFPTVTGIGAGYFAATGIHIVRGSDFPQVAGAALARSVIVNEAMAKGTWPGQDPIGKCMRFESRLGDCHTVVGVVENSRMDKVIEAPQPMYYLPLQRLPAAASFLTGGDVVVRAAPEQIGNVALQIRALTRQRFPGGIPRLHTLEERLEPQYRPWRLGATLFSAFGVLALVVAVIGIYSTVSYGVTQRVHEFGVRIALGARLGDVVRLVVGEGLRTLAVGIALGLGLAIVAGRFVSSLLYGVRPNDPSAFALVAAVLLAAGVLAALVPAWRAARVDPARALRAD